MDLAVAVAAADRRSCVAQLDLAEIAAFGLPYEMPSEGVVAFFIDTASLSTGEIRGTISPVPERLEKDEHPFPAEKKPLYGAAVAGYCSDADSPTAFPRWPLTFFKARQSGERYAPDLDTLFGPVAKSVHLELEGMVSGERKNEHFFPVEDASPFPVRAASMILNDTVNLIHRVFRHYVPPLTTGSRDHLDDIQKRVEIAQKVIPILEPWSERLGALDVNAPLSADLGPKFLQDIVDVQQLTKALVSGLRVQFGSGTTMTASAAQRAYFDMYVESAESYAAIPDPIRDQIEDCRMRTAYKRGMVHQVFGEGANVQTPSFDTDGMAMFLQIATDEAMRFEWGDVGVAQFWIYLDDLANGNWHNARLDVQRH